MGCGPGTACQQHQERARWWNRRCTGTIPGPFWSGVNLSFVNKAKLIIDGNIKVSSKPWQLQNDGDLWDLFARIVDQRGRWSIRVSWVKGHAKQKHLNRGITTPWRKWGNDRADDIAANKGHKAHPDGLHTLGEHLEERHEMYEDLIHHVHMVIVQTFAEDQRLRKQAKDLEAPPLLQAKRDRRKLVAKRPYHPQPEDIIDLDVGPPPQAYPNNEHIHALCALVCFLAARPGCQPPAAQLMMLYVIRGGRVDDAHGPTAHAALPRPGILPAIQLFKRWSKTSWRCMVDP